MERYPLSWPADKPRTLAAARKQAQFKSYKMPLTIADAVNRIHKELDGYTPVGKSYRVPEETIIISTNKPAGVKGRPLSSGAEPQDPGAAVYFQLDGQEYCLPCDKWDRLADNLAAIAAHIGAMRGIERWGVGTSKDVYTGFKALPENAGSSNGAWWLILEVDQDTTGAEIRAAYKRLSAKYHPDNISTGNKDKFIQVQTAYKEAMAKFK